MDADSATSSSDEHFTCVRRTPHGAIQFIPNIKKNILTQQHITF